MPLRRPHRKSRHGCKACKQRRVKCDERRPVCSNCSQREEPCEYVAEASYIWAADKPRRRTRRKASEQNDIESPHVIDESFSLLDTFGARQTPTSVPPLDMTQLRLLVNWQNETCQFFSRDQETRVVWQIYLVDEALQSSSLMHGILAVSALHLALADSGPDQAFWLGLATAHKGEALQWLRESVHNVTPDNSRTMLGLSALVVAFAFGSALLSDADKPSLNALNDVFVLCRGVQHITNPAYPYLRESNFAPLFSPGRPSIPIPDRARESLDHLDHLNAEYHHAADHDMEIYGKVIAAMRDLSSHAFCQPNSMTLAAGWAIRCSPEYLEDIQAQRPFAMVVHAHYCAFLHVARGNWFVQGWGRFVLEDIIRILDPMWKPHISWPVSEVLGECC
ncbi:hypothetical protein BJX99DRAFT_104608 [Aspergillus californicus]